MPEFSYVARSAEGKLIEGVITSNDRAAAILQLEQQRQVPIRITAVAANARAAKPGKADAPRRSDAPDGPETAGVPAAPVQTLPLSHQFLFTEQLGHLLGAGMTLDEALGILVRRLQQPKLKAVSKSLHQSLIDGRSLSQALRDFPRIFSPLYVNMVSAGEASGALPIILRRLVTHLADVKALRDRVQQALVYPAVLVVAGIGLVIVFMTVMVPQLSGFFAQTGQQLPLPTRILLAANRLLVGYWWVALGGIAAAYAGLKAFTRSRQGKKAWDYFRLRIPGYGLVMRYRFYAQFARTLATLMENGVTLLKSLELLEDIADNEFIRQQMVEVRRAVIDGASLSQALRAYKLFPELFLDMMSVGEQTGRFGETMQMIADMYERELDKQVKIISALIPPLIMVAIAAIVGLVVFGILSAVFNLTSGLRGRIR
jgi:type II secretory pathway component PulF